MPWIDEKTAKPVEITDEAIDLYAEMKKLRCTCDCPSISARGFFRGPQASGVTCAFEPRGIFICPLCFARGTLAQRWVPETPPGQTPFGEATHSGGALVGSRA
jgi:hypothetical protein